MFTRSIDEVLRRQNPDGGWGYSGSSWAEPTSYALLALQAAGQGASSAEHGFAWLATLQRQDGGWAPHPDVNESTWVTAVVLLASGDRLRSDQRARALGWLLKQTGEEAGLVYRLRRWMLGGRSEYAEVHPGWPWFPGTAAWTTPTALSMLALKKIGHPDEAVRLRIEEGRAFLLSRMCQDGGWNHGSSKALGFQSNSYPETTGLALLALRGVEPALLARSISRARAHFSNCRSAEGVAWLQLGLLAHGESLARPAVPQRTFADTALTVIAEAALDGRTVFGS